MSSTRTLLTVLLLFICILFLPKNILAQTESKSFQVGVTSGINATTHLKNFKISSSGTFLSFRPKTRVGYQFGFIFRKKITDAIRVQAEPSFVEMGAKYEQPFQISGFEFETESKTDLLYIHLPLVFQLSTTPPKRTIYGRQRPETTFHLSGGVFGGYLLDATFSGTNTGTPIGIEFQGTFSNNVKNQYKDFDGGFLLGLGFENGHRSKIGFEARFFMSLLPSGDDPEINFKPQNIGATFSLYYMI